MVQFGELSFAIYVFTLFHALRHGPNSAYTPLDPGLLSEREFWNVQTFLLIVIVGELLSTLVIMRLAIRNFVFDPRENIGEVYLFTIVVAVVVTFIPYTFAFTEEYF